MIPFEAMFMAAEALAARRSRPSGISRSAIGHGIDAGGLRHGGLFLAKAFAGPKALEGARGAAAPLLRDVLFKA